jgi:hypothetical protein
MSIEKQLNLKFPIYWNGWPIEKEFAKYLIYTIVTNKPLNIVELGSGTSSLIILKTLKKLGCKYRLTSVDSDKIFLEKTKNLLLAEDVYDEDNVKLIFAPIKELILGEEKYKWYDRDKLNFDFDKIDSKGYVFQIELKYMATKKGFSYKEKPIVFKERLNDKSKFKLSIIIEAFLKVFKIKFKYK